MREPEQITIKQEAQNNSVGYSWTSKEYPKGSLINIGMNWRHRGSTGMEYGKRTVKLSENQYRIDFEDIGFGNYDDLSVIVDIENIDNCGEDAPECDGEQEQIKFGIREISAGDYSNYDFCKYETVAGQFKPLFEDQYYNIGPNELINSFDINICFNKSNKTWQYSIINGAIYINAILAICDENLARFNVIREFRDLDNLTDEEALLALHDFKASKIYGGGDGRDGEYKIYDAIWMHEKTHENRFRNLISQILNKKSTKNPFGLTLNYKELFI